MDLKIPSETDHLMQSDGSLVDVSRTLSSMGPMGMPLMSQIGQMQLHQISPAMLQSLAPPHLHAIGPQMHPTLHPMHPHIAQLHSSMVHHVVPHHEHMHGQGMEGPVMEGTQPLDAIVAAAAVSGEN